MSTGPPIHQESFTVRSFEVDLTHRLKMGTLCSLFQEVASNHACLLGVGYEQMRERNLFWVLSRLLVKIEHMPSWHVNNIQYIHWVLNCFPPDQFEQHPVRSFQINFLAESRYQDVLQLFCSQNPDAPASFIVTGKKSGDHFPSFSAKVAFSGELDTGIGS